MFEEDPGRPRGAGVAAPFVAAGAAVAVLACCALPALAAAGGATALGAVAARLAGSRWSLGLTAAALFAALSLITLRRRQRPPGTEGGDPRE